MIQVYATQNLFSGEVDQIVLQTPAGTFTIRELVKSDQPGQLMITSDDPMVVIQDGRYVYLGTVKTDRRENNA